MLKIEKENLMLNGKPFKIISGAMHYFRVPDAYWKDRLLKLKACGLNTVETYMPWNAHQPTEDAFCFEGMLGVSRFAAIAAEVGLYVIIRPGPYICAEWEGGGLPSWLLKNPDMRMRCNCPSYIRKVDVYLDEVIKRLKPHFITNGGNIIAMQVENEYGSFGNDKRYLNHMRDGLIKRGVDVLLFTSDGWTDSMLTGGMIENVWETCNFGSRADEAFDKLLEFQPNKPLMCMEFWCGWFDHWDKPHHVTDVKAFSNTLDAILTRGSVNFYMFHGGTNFGFMNGANFDMTKCKYEPTVTSYDYDALLDEAGRPTDKFFAARDIIFKHTDLEQPALPEPLPIAVYADVTLDEEASLFDVLEHVGTRHESAAPLSMEEYGQDYGYILYRTKVGGPLGKQTLNIDGLHDRAHIFADGKFIGIMHRNEPETRFEIEVDENGILLEILVENQGRINYGPKMMDRKGITKAVRLGALALFGWEVYCMPMTNFAKIPWSSRKSTNLPAFLRGHFDVETPTDTFINTEGFGKGFVVVNGFNLGRFWEVGPTKTVYLPAPYLKPGRNEIIVFETDTTAPKCLSFTDTPML